LQPDSNIQVFRHLGTTGGQGADGTGADGTGALEETTTVVEEETPGEDGLGEELPGTVG